MARTELPNGVILPAEYSDDWYEDMTSNLTKLDDVIGSDSEKLNSNDVAFLRMSSAALTDGGTGNFSDLNSSNKLKTGDYVLDSGRKLYQVVSVDSTNETFTVGNSLFKITAESDLAPVAESGDYDDLDNKPDLNPYDQHIVNTDIHVTTADKTKWNNGVSQSYVLRYSSSSVTDNSTIAYSTLDNTDNIKASDKIIDSDGKIFSIVSVDTANQTVTVGSALIDLALDANVVHTSGNETKNGELTASKFISNYFQSNTGNILIQSNGTNRSVSIFNGSSAGDGGGFWAYGKDSVNGSDCRLQIYNTAKSRYERVDLINSQFLPTPSGELDCGGTANKWKSFNGLTPSSLSMPSDRSARVDISGYITNLGNGDTNAYTVPANGYIWLHLTSVTDIICYSQTSSTMTNYAQTFTRSQGDGQLYAFLPVRKDDRFVVQIYTSSTGVVQNAYFIPCQGNI